MHSFSVKLTALLCAVLLCAVSLTACQTAPPDTPNDPSVPDSGETDAPASSENKPSTAAQAFALYTSAEEAQAAASSFVCDGTILLSLPVGNAQITATGTVRSVVSDALGDSLACATSTSVTLQTTQGENTTSSAMEECEGFSHGQMFYSISETENGIQSVSRKLRSPLSADDYRAHLALLSDEMTVDKTVCKKASYAVDENGQKTATFSGFTKQGLLYFTMQLGDLNELFEDDVTLKDVKLTLCCDENNLPISQKTEFVFSQSDLLSSVPKITIDCRFSDWNTAAAPQIVLDDYEEVEDLRAADWFERGVEQNLYYNSGSYLLYSQSTMQYGANTTTSDNAERVDFSNQDSRFSYSGTISSGVNESTVQYEDGMLTVSVEDGGYSVSQTDEAMRQMLRDSLDPASFSKNRMLDIRKDSVTDEYTQYAITLTDSALLSSILQSVGGGTLESYYEQLIFRLDGNGDLIGVAHEIRFTISGTSFGTVSLFSATEASITLS